MKKKLKQKIQPSTFEKIKQYTIEIIGILLGSLIMACSLAFFLVPHKIAPGGVSGLSTILYHTFHLQVGITMLALNIPLFLIGVRFLGTKFGVRTIIGTISVSFFTDFLIEFLQVPIVTDNKALSALYGGVIMGIGLGIIFKSKGSTGGTDIVAQIMDKYTNITTGMAIIIIDFFIISLAGFVFENADLALYAFISLYVSSRLIDIILEGMDYVKMAYIISIERSEEIAEAIISEMRRGATSIYSRGVYTNRDRELIMCVVTRKEITELQELVEQIDPNAFIIITEVHEVLGHGFRKRY